ncbi:MAG: hypothetical protein IPK80_13345 [Nannocystis sp.]|nr:hypothetical protein [Nannocystis sp.]
MLVLKPLRARSLPFAAALALASPGLLGCSKEQAAASGEGAAAAESAGGGAAGAAAVEKQGPPPMPTTPATLDELLALAPAGATAGATVIAIRDPGALLEVTAEGFGFYEQPIGALAGLLASRGDAALGELADLARAGAEYAEARRRFEAARVKISEAGIGLHRGLLIVQAGDHALMIVGAAKPEALPGLFAGLAEGAAASPVVCKPVDGAAGYAACADTQAELDRYQPGGKAAELRASLTGALPSVDLDGAHAVALVRGDEPVSAALTMSGGELGFHVGIPAGDEAFAAARGALMTGKPELLRFVQPGTGFVWARGNSEMIQAQVRAAELPEMVSGVADDFTGELLVAGSSFPPALQVRLGLRESGGVAGLVEVGSMFSASVPKTIPGVAGSKLKMSKETIAGGSALHLAASGIPQVEALREKLGFSLDLWLFAADGALGVVAGASPEGVAKMANGAGDPATIAALPASLRQSLERGQASVVLHLPMDPLHGPLLRSLLEELRGASKDFDPELARASLGLSGPLSSLSMWLTQQDERMVAHVSFQLIGDATTEEGKAALKAAREVAAGGDAKAIFGALIAQYGGSPRVTAYKARAGEGGAGDLVGSAIGAVVGAVAVTLPALTAMGLVEGTVTREPAATEVPAAPAPVEPKPAAPKSATPTPKPAAPKDTSSAGTPAGTTTRPGPATPPADPVDRPTEPAKPPADPVAKPADPVAKPADPAGAEPTKPKRVGRQPAAQPIE